jgi:Ran GTPase-activating protein (RanGAP) involved in mRNA processing and transport
MHALCWRLARDDKHLTDLDLAGLNIGNTGVTALGASLDTNTSLESLSLSYNLISSTGVTRLLDGVTRNLKSLDLMSNSIGNGGAQALANMVSLKKAQLQNLSVRNNYIGALGGIQLANALQDNLSLEQLDMGTNPIGNAGAKAIADLLRVNKTLRWLCLWSNDLDAEGIRCIAQALRENTTLEVLYLGGNMIDNEGAMALADMLRHNTTLKSLHIANGRIGSKGALALAQVLTENGTLQVLDILHNPIGSDGATAFCNVLKSQNRTIKELRLDYQFTTRSPIEDYCYKGVNAEIMLYLKLNQIGRAEMTNLALHDGLWPSILEKVNIQADLMRLTLQEKPELLQRLSC